MHRIPPERFDPPEDEAIDIINKLAQENLNEYGAADGHHYYTDPSFFVKLGERKWLVRRYIRGTTIRGPTRAQIEAPKRYRYYIYTEPEAKHDLRKLRDDELEEIRSEHMDIAIPDMDARDYDK